MSFSISKMALVAAALTSPVLAAETGKSTRYWDCCKPSCAWAGKADVSSPIGTCDKNNSPLSDPNAKSGCDGGNSYTCGSYSPWSVNDDLSYGFAATKLSGESESDWCCACYKVTFTSGPVSGKTMIVQSTNTGGDLGNNHFDLLIPGGGVGIFNGCASQFGGLPGAQYGGISSASDCESFPSYLKAGCKWRFDWFQNADNPDLTFERVKCPSAITDVSGCVRSDDANYPAAGTNNSESPSSAASSAAASKASSVATNGSSSTTSKAAEPQPTSSQASNEGSQSSAVESKPASSQTLSTTTADAAKETVKPPKSCKHKRHLQSHHHRHI